MPRLPGDRLDSWKEIAAYTTRGVRTVRRWEREEGMPVHRHVHRTLGSIYAYKSEIDTWREGRAGGRSRTATPRSSGSAVAGRTRAGEVDRSPALRESEHRPREQVSSRTASPTK